MRTEPWIDPEGASPGEIMEVIRRCPSGALSYSIDGVEHRDQDRQPAVQLSKDGPYRVTGGIALEGVEWLEGTSAEHYTLCRCGGSKNKPFCDGTHWYVRFRDDERLVEGAGETRLAWHRVAEPDALPDRGMMAVSAGTRGLILVRQGGSYRAFQQSCPHQGGPLGEGSLEDGHVVCPWHGWRFSVESGQAATEGEPGLAAFDVELRDDGIYVAVEERLAETRTVADVMVETMVNWGVSHVFGMVGHSNLGLAEAVRRESERGYLSYVGVRHEGAAAFAASAYAKLTGRPAACLTIAGPGATNLLTGLWDAHVDRAPVLALTGQVDTQVLGPGGIPGDRPALSLRGGGVLEPDGASLEPSRGADEPGAQARSGREGCGPPDLPRRGPGPSRVGRDRPRRPRRAARHDPRSSAPGTGRSGRRRSGTRVSRGMRKTVAAWACVSPRSRSCGRRSSAPWPTGGPGRGAHRPGAGLARHPVDPKAPDSVGITRMVMRSCRLS